mmetsp:Transcript_44730/g.97385  ORF Transcript_44730/g.97385 Transcript_44730/m.97385 type:complete len:312 (+) Transcript_44730:111-1046(+)
MTPTYAWTVPTLLVGLLICLAAALGMLAASKRRGIVAFPKLPPTCLAGSTLDERCYRCGPLVLAVFRASCFGWQATVLSLDFVVHGDKRAFLFFTIWNFILQIMYWFLASAASGLYLSRSQVPKVLRRLLPVLFEVCFPSALLVSLILWGILTPHDVTKGWQKEDFNFYSYDMHAVNTACLAIEMLLSRLLVRADHFFCMLLWAFVFCAFAWLQHIWTNFWPYFFLDVSTPRALLWYAAVVVIHIFIYTVVVALSHLKLRRFPSLRTRTHLEGLPSFNDVLIAEAEREQPADSAAEQPTPKAARAATLLPR